MLVIQRNVIQLTATQSLGTFQFLLESVLQPGRFQGSEKALCKETSGDAAMWQCYRKPDSQDRKCVEKTSFSMDKSWFRAHFFLNDSMTKVLEEFGTCFPRFGDVVGYEWSGVCTSGCSKIFSPPKHNPL